MKYTLSIPQAGIINGGFDIDVMDAVILDFLITFSHSPQVIKRMENNECYYWFDYSYILKNIPLLNLKKDAVYRRMKKMCDVGLLIASHENQKLGRPFFNITASAVNLYFKSEGMGLNPNPYGLKPEPPTVQNPNPLRSETRTPTAQKPDDYIIIDNIIKDTTIKDKIIIDSTPTPPASPVVDSKKNKEGLIIPWDTSGFTAAWDHWKEFKKGEHKFSYKTLLSEQAALNHLVKIVGGNEQLAIDTIYYSISQGWKGIYLNRDAGKTNTKTGNGGSAVPTATDNQVVQAINSRFNKTK